MSIWSRCHGTVVIPKTSGFSLKKYVLTQYDEVVFHQLDQENQGEDIRIEFDFAFSLDGMGAAKMIEGLVNTLTAISGYRWSQIESEIRFI